LGKFGYAAVRQKAAMFAFATQPILNVRRSRFLFMPKLRSVRFAGFCVTPG